MGSAITNNDGDHTLPFFHNPILPYSGMQAKGNEDSSDQARELADVLRGILQVKNQSCHLQDDHNFPATPSTGDSGVFSPLSVLEHQLHVYAKHPLSMLEINNDENILLQDPFIDAEGASMSASEGSNSEHIPLFLDNFGAMPAFGSMLDRISMDERTYSYSTCSMQYDNQQLEPINQINAAKVGSIDDFNKIRGGEFSPGLTVMGHPCMLQGVNIAGATAVCCSARGSPSASDCDSNASGSNNKPTCNGDFGAKVGYAEGNGNTTCNGVDFGVKVVYAANDNGNTTCNKDGYEGKLVNYADNDEINDDPTCEDGSVYYRTSMREVVYAAAALQPVDWESIMEATASSRPKRRNVRISKDPQSVSARRRRERISDRIRVLQRLVPGGTKMDTASMLDEAIHYLKFLKSQIQALEWLERSSSSPPSPYYYYPSFTTPSATKLINKDFSTSCLLPQCPS